MRIICKKPSHKILLCDATPGTVVIVPSVGINTYYFVVKNLDTGALGLASLQTGVLENWEASTTTVMPIDSELLITEKNASNLNYYFKRW